MTWSNQVYYHHNTGRGIVAGPVNQAGLPGLFAVVFSRPELVECCSAAPAMKCAPRNIASTGRRALHFRLELGDHQIEAGIWYEHNDSSTARRWYPFSAANNDLTPYDVPRNPAFTQYYVALKTDDVQLHVQDQWQHHAELLLQAGIKASLQTAGNRVDHPAVDQPAAANPPAQYPTGSHRHRTTGSCRRWARSGTRPTTSSCSSTSRRTCASSSPTPRAAISRLLALEPGQPGGVQRLQGHGPSGNLMDLRSGRRARIAMSIWVR